MGDMITSGHGTTGDGAPFGTSDARTTAWVLREQRRRMAVQQERSPCQSYLELPMLPHQGNAPLQLSQHRIAVTVMPVAFDMAGHPIMPVGFDMAGRPIMPDQMRQIALQQGRSPYQPNLALPMPPRQSNRPQQQSNQQPAVTQTPAPFDMTGRATNRPVGSPPPIAPPQFGPLHANCDARADDERSERSYHIPRPWRMPKKIHRDFGHWCGWEDCWTLPESEQPLLVKNIDHVPICHDSCWRREMMKHHAIRRAQAHHEQSYGFPTCHRTCYHSAIWKTRLLKYPWVNKVRYVPRNRTLRERSRLYKLQHYAAERGLPKGESTRLSIQQIEEYGLRRSLRLGARRWLAEGRSR